MSRSGFRCSLWISTAALLGGGALPLSAQISLGSAVNLALKNSPKVMAAQADVLRAQAVLAQSKEAFVPAISATGGVGKSTGAPLNPPVIFSIGAQSLVFNSAQPDNIRAARAGVNSARLALDAARSDVVEDATNTYVALDNALQRRAVQTAAFDHAHRLASITEERFEAGVDAHIEVTKARHTEAQIHLQTLLLEDEIANDADHLARLTGLSPIGLNTEHASIPDMQPPQPSPSRVEDDPRQMVGVSAAFEAAEAKRYTAHGEKHYLLRPQIAFNANYSRISTAFTTYTQYYPAFGNPGNSFNSLSLGVEFTVPILDMVHRAKARELAADAAHSLYEAQAQQMLFLEGRNKLRHSTAELAARSEVAGLDRELAQDQLDAVMVRLQSPAGAMQGEQLTPKDEQNARLQERLRTLDMLNAELQLREAEVSLMRQEGSLTRWLTGTIPSAGAPSTNPGSASPTSLPSPSAPLAPTVGITPGGATQPSGTVPTAPTTGTPPASLPSGPVTAPAPTTPTTTPSVPTPGTPHP